MLMLSASMGCIMVDSVLIEEKRKLTYLQIINPWEFGGGTGQVKGLMFYNSHQTQIKSFYDHLHFALFNKHVCT